MGDLVDSMIENRAVLEKINVLESKMRYQIDKLMRIAEEPSTRLTDGKDYLQSNSHMFLLVFFYCFFFKKKRSTCVSSKSYVPCATCYVSTGG